MATREFKELKTTEVKPLLHGPFLKTTEQKKKCKMKSIAGTKRKNRREDGYIE